MSAPSAAEARLARVSPRNLARVAAVSEFLEALCSAGGQVFILGRLIVSGNAAATAANILAHEALFRAGFALSVAAVPFHLVWALCIHRLFAPVHRGVSRLAIYVILVGCALQAVAAALYVAPIVLLQNPAPFAALSTPQLQALAYAFLRVTAQTYNLYLVFFGFWCVLVGWLMFRSTFFPRVFGVLWMIDGLGWMLYLWPPLGTALFPAIAAVSALAELPMPWWLFFAGVNEPRWRERALAAAED